MMEQVWTDAIIQNQLSDKTQGFLSRFLMISCI